MGLQGQGRGGGGGGEVVGCKDQNPKLTVAECGRLPPPLGADPASCSGRGGQGASLSAKPLGNLLISPQTSGSSPEIWISWIQEGSTRRPLLWIHPWGRLHCQVQVLKVRFLP